MPATAAVVVEIADLVVDMLNAADLGRAFQAARAYAPTHEADDIRGLEVTVVPARMGITLTTVDRARRHTFDYTIHVGIQQRIEPPAVTEDELMVFVEAIVDLFRSRGLPVRDETARCIAVANEPIFAPEHLHEWGVFTSVVSLTFRLTR